MAASPQPPAAAGRLPLKIAVAAAAPLVAEAVTAGAPLLPSLLLPPARWPPGWKLSWRGCDPKHWLLVLPRSSPHCCCAPGLPTSRCALQLVRRGWWGGAEVSAALAEVSAALAGKKAGRLAGSRGATDATDLYSHKGTPTPMRSDHRLKRTRAPTHSLSPSLPHPPARYSSSVFTSFLAAPPTDPAALSRPEEPPAASLEAALLLAAAAAAPEDPLRARIWDLRFLAAAASCSFCSCAWVLGGAAFVMEVLATLLAGGRWGRRW